MPQQLTPELITLAIEGLEARQQAIGRQIQELRAMLPGASSDGNSTPARKRGGKRVMSEEGRARIAEAQRRRWAVARGEAQTSAPTKTPQKRKRRLSAEGRAAIVAALKKRWAAKRGGTAQPAPAKKAAGKKAASKTPAKAVKRVAAKRSVAKKTAPAAAPATQPAG